MTSYGLFPRVLIIHGSLCLTLSHIIMTLLTSNLFCTKTLLYKAVCYGNHVRSRRHRFLDLFHRAALVSQPRRPAGGSRSQAVLNGGGQTPTRERVRRGIDQWGPRRRSRQGGCGYSCIWRCAEYCARILKPETWIPTDEIRMLKRRRSYRIQEE